MGQSFTSTALAALMLSVATPVVAQSSDVARRFAAEGFVALAKGLSS